MGKTITGTTTLGVTLTTSPTTIAGTISTQYQTALYGSAAKPWRIANLGTMSLNSYAGYVDAFTTNNAISLFSSNSGGAVSYVAFGH